MGDGRRFEEVLTSRWVGEAGGDDAEESVECEQLQGQEEGDEDVSPLAEVQALQPTGGHEDREGGQEEPHPCHLAPRCAGKIEDQQPQ